MNENNFYYLIKSDLKAFKKKDKVTLLTWLNLVNPKFYPSILIRLSQFFYKYKLTKLFSYFTSFLNTIIFGIEVTPRCKIGFSLYIPHTVGTVIGAYQIGNNVTIFQGVTLGAKFADINYDISERPCVGNNVIIGAGAKILGPIKIGNNSIIASNSLVLTDLPDSSFAIGVPAIIKINKKIDE